jgi:guanylate kinase
LSEGKIIIVCAPSGAGKSTLIKRLKEKFPELVESVSTTTRAKRDGEVEGKEYFFISEKEFKGNLDKFIEWAKVHNNFYGTGKKFIEENISKGKFILCDVDIQGCDNFKRIYKDKAKVIFVIPPSLRDLELRLRKRGTESEESIGVRLANAKIEMKRQNDFDFKIINDDLDRAFKELESIVGKILKGNL